MKMPPTLTTYYPMAGGPGPGDATPTESPGQCIDALNYEPTTVGGYPASTAASGSTADRRRQRRATGDRHHADRQHRQWRNCDRGHQRGDRARSASDSNTTLVLGRDVRHLCDGEALQVTAVTSHRHQCRHAQRRHAAGDRRLQFLAANDRQADIAAYWIRCTARRVHLQRCRLRVPGQRRGTAGNLWKSSAGEAGAGDVRTRTAVHRAVGEITAKTVTGLFPIWRHRRCCAPMLSAGTWTVSVRTLILPA